MKAAVFTATLLAVLGGVTPVLCQDSLLLDTWAHSYSDPGRLDDFIEAHRAQYTDDYFGCSQEAQRLIREEANIRDRRCDFSPDSGVRGRCRKENQFRGIDKQLEELDQAIQNHTPWLDLESGRNAEAAARAAEQLERTCTPPACDIAKIKRQGLPRDLGPFLQCPPITERPIDVDPSFKNFELPSDPGG